MWGRGLRGAVLAGEVERVDYRATDSGELVSLVWSESFLAWCHLRAEPDRLAAQLEPLSATRRRRS
ncbi:hypothetical protein [Nonomuraea sp. NPDC050643]|uniref:hypothetical protein n=1 Tax=Nonomuraea sp. NPDC050643 TaxID=3155660 RepID=UPI0033E63D2A